MLFAVALVEASGPGILAVIIAFVVGAAHQARDEFELREQERMARYSEQERMRRYLDEEGPKH